MKEPQPLISILITVGYFLFRNLVAMMRNKTESIKHPDLRNSETVQTLEDSEENLNWETDYNWEQHEWETKEDESIPRYAKEIVMPAARTTLATTTLRQASLKSGINPVYPGIKRLLLPTHEKDPYKLYEKTFPKPTNRLNHLLRNYNSSQRAIIMAELLKRKI
jgi:hypothetical protein